MTDYNEIEEHELVEEARKGNQSAFGELVRRNEHAVATVIKGMLGDTENIEDVGQEVFIRFYNNLDQFKGEAKLKTYLTKIAINLSLNELKKRSKNHLRIVKNDFETYTENASTSDEEKIEAKEIIQKGLLLLEIEFRSVIVLRLIEGYSTKEVAKILDIPLGTVLSRLARGQKKLKNILTPLIK